MTSGEAIKSIMRATNTTQEQLARRNGIKYQSSISMALNRDMKASHIVMFAESMGYELVLQRKRPGRRGGDQVVIDMAGTPTED